jgi:hypothetical protein
MFFKVEYMKYILIVLLLSTYISAGCQPAQRRVSKPIPTKYFVEEKNSVVDYELKKALNQASNLQDFLPRNFVKDGTVDYTKFIQKFLDDNLVVLFPNFPLLVSHQGLNLKSNQVLIFQPASKVLMKPNNQSHYSILNLAGVKNVTLFNPVLVGDLNEHQGNAGEWGHGINVLSSSDINIYNANISHCWGDGIYIGENKTSKGKSSQNIQILSSQINQNRRNGVSIISVVNLLIENSLISNTIGTPPMAGIDIEPNNNNNEIRNIRIVKTTTFNCRNGLVLMLNKLAGEKLKSTSIDIVDYTDEDSDSGFVLAGYGVRPRKAKPISGQITLKRIRLINNKKGFKYNNNTFGLSPSLKIKDFRFIKTENNKVIVDKEKTANMKNSLHGKRGISITD